MNTLKLLQNVLVASCQPVDDGPMDDPRITAAMALAAEAGGAQGLRIEGLDNLAATRPVTKLPIIGIVKRDLPDSEVRITPFLEDVKGLADLGADVIAYDATQRLRPVPTADIVAAIKAAGKLAMADAATLADGQQALAEGVDILGTTLSGYAYDIAPAEAGPDYALIRAYKELGAFVMAEGRLNTPERAEGAIRQGADCVTVGSAITRIEHITGWFADAVKRSQND
ncbi:N-acetylmannosamine-6-phosphate 2-epimerase [Thalassobius sp. MITS945101]|uniref:N-acetylmannosamine-6-phosphate 2-epimerase n=1 Tax=Thalassobius sp. MITS945101 TaxID=3096994 RepID=UPI00399B8054